MNEIEIKLKLKFSGKLSDEEADELLKKLRSLLIYGNDNGLITPEESEILLKSVWLSIPSTDKLYGTLFNS
jgi:hypothetical protein